MNFLSPAEIQHQELPARRGKYRVEDVERLLERVAASYEQVWLERDRLREQVGALEGELAALKEMETTFRDSIVAAHRTADEVGSAAAREADAMLEEARRQAAEIVDEARRERERLQEQIGMLESHERESTERYRGLLLSALEALGEPARSEESEAAEREAEAAADVPAEPAKTALDTADWEIPYALYEDDDELAASDGRRRRDQDG